VTEPFLTNADATMPPRPGLRRNWKPAGRDRLSQCLVWSLRLVLEEVFSPETVAYLTEKVNRALVRKTMPPDALPKQKQAELDQARTELANIEKAILLGVVTATTKRMLEGAERRVAALEAGRRTASRPKVVDLSSVVTRYMTDLRATFGRDNDRARKALSKLVDQVVLRRHGDRLMAEVRGNLKGLLDLEESFGNAGAGRGIFALPKAPVAIGRVA
jgi:hypothetical protein